MRVDYLGPLCAGFSYPALEGIDTSAFGFSCYLVEVSPEAGVDGPLIEGDVLVVDEARPPRHADLVVAEVEDCPRLYRTFRIGSQLLLLPPAGQGRSRAVQAPQLRGVVVEHARF